MAVHRKEVYLDIQTGTLDANVYAGGGAAGPHER